MTRASNSFFRGLNAVTFDDVRQIIPFVLHDKLTQNADSPYFDSAEAAQFRTDKIGWIRSLFDLSCREYDRLNIDADDPVRQLDEEFAAGLEGLSAADARSRLVRIERLLGEWSRGRKLYGLNDLFALAPSLLHFREQWFDPGEKQTIR